MTLRLTAQEIASQHIFVYCLPARAKVDNLFCMYACQKYHNEICFEEQTDYSEDTELMGMGII